MNDDALTEGLDVVTAPWRTRTRRVAYENPWIRVEEDVVDLPNGVETLYGIVRCKPCVGVLPFVDENHVLLVQQYRYVAGRATWEMPTGACNVTEALEESAQRELAEEAGLRARRLVKLTEFHTSKSVVDETAHLYLALDLHPAPASPDPTELIRRQVWAFDEVVRMVTTAAITDSMTMIAVLIADRMRRDNWWPGSA